MARRIVRLLVAVVALSFVVQPAWAQRLAPLAARDGSIHLVHGSPAKPGVKSAKKASKAAPMKSKPSAAKKGGSHPHPARS